jgi:hypothetical protein
MDPYMLNATANFMLLFTKYIPLSLIDVNNGAVLGCKSVTTHRN